eukprot:360908-Chlamydomonas_euryale.AAC.14
MDADIRQTVQRYGRSHGTMCQHKKGITAAGETDNHSAAETHTAQAILLQLLCSLLLNTAACMSETDLMATSPHHCHTSADIGSGTD